MTAERKKKGFKKVKIDSRKLAEKKQTLKDGSRSKFRSELLEDQSFYKPRDSENYIRIIQPLEVEELGYYGKEIYFHREVGALKGNFPCLKQMQGKRCVVCETQTNDLWETNRDYAKTLYPTQRVLMWILDLKLRDDEENYNKPLLWSCARTLAEDILGQSHKKGTEVYINVSDPFEGRAIYFDKEGKGINTKYKNVQLADEPDELDPELVDELVLFDDTINWATYDEVKESFEDNEDKKEEEESTTSEDEKAMDRAEHPDCFGKEFDVYESCDDCNNRDDCKVLCKTEDPTPEPEPEDDTSECFGKEYDTYESCDGCSKNEDCKATQFPPKTKKKKKVNASEGESENESPSGSAVRQRLQNAIKKHKKDK